MSYVVVKHPGVQIDIMVLKEHWPELVSIIQRTGCRYKKEDQLDISSGKSFVVIRDVQAGSMHAISEFFDYLNKNINLNSSNEEKFYILMRPKKRKVKKNVQENRPENDEGCKGGAGQEPTGDIESGENPGIGGGSVGDSGNDSNSDILSEDSQETDNNCD